jgi:hypothetical protein
VTDYFHRRNLPQTEYSGHEQISDSLRFRLAAIWKEYVARGNSYKHRLDSYAIEHQVSLQLPGWDGPKVLKNGEYFHVFTLVEILVSLAGNGLTPNRQVTFRRDLLEAFRLSGSVYQLKNSRVELELSKDTAEKLSEAQAILSPYQKSYQTFFNAVGDLVGRRKPTKDIIKDLFVGAEGYLKELTGENDFGDAIRALAKRGAVSSIQKTIMLNLYGYRSDADGVAHSGNSESPGEIDALWFLETTLAQINLIHRKTSAGKS